MDGHCWTICDNKEIVEENKIFSWKILKSSALFVNFGTFNSATYAGGFFRPTLPRTPLFYAYKIKRDSFCCNYFLCLIGRAGGACGEGSFPNRNGVWGTTGRVKVVFSVFGLRGGSSRSLGWPCPLPMVMPPTGFNSVHPSSLGLSNRGLSNTDCYSIVLCWCRS